MKKGYKYNWLLEWDAVSEIAQEKRYRTRFFAVRKRKKLRKRGYTPTLWWIGYTPLK